MLKYERDFYLGKAHEVVKTFYQDKDKPYLLDALMDASRVPAQESAHRKLNELTAAVVNFLAAWESRSVFHDQTATIDPLVEEMRAALRA